jgi:hypothetical protein
MTTLNKTRHQTTCLFLLTLLLSAGARAQSGPITSAMFGMQCSVSNDCANGLPTTQAQPGMLRLWDSRVAWSFLDTSDGNYNWVDLDTYLDDIAKQTPPKAVVYTFGWVPCWDANSCSGGVPGGTNAPPKDLTSTGSPSFNKFVKALTLHCSPEFHCVKDYIKYYEMWNEANFQTFWIGGETPLYQMVAPAVAIIKTNVPGAQILTPSVTSCKQSSTCTDFQTWQTAWLKLENTKGIISNIYNFHTYLQNNRPEDRWPTVQQMLDVRPAKSYWTTIPWWNDETNFSPTFSCIFTSQDCTGQIVRWQLLHLANGGSNLNWYKWLSTMTNTNPPYEPAYYFMMQYLLGGNFTAACSASNGTWTCPFNETGNLKIALFVWAPAGNTNYDASGWSDYRDLSGVTTGITNPSITIGVEPLMLEK